MDDEIKRRFGTIPTATQYSGIGRSSLYKLAPEYPGLFVKFGGATRVNFAILDKIMDGLPHARIKPSSRRRGEGA
jgi:hypothetical protein